MKAAPSADGDQNPVQCVFLLDENTAVLRAVETGLQDDMYIEITSGLEEGTQIITGPYDVVSQKLADGQTVQSVDKSELYNEKK